MPAFIDRNDDPAASSGSGQNGTADSCQARVLDPRALVAHRAVLYRVALALCRSHHEAEDLVQDTFTRVLARPRVMRRGTDLPYLLRALRNTHTTSTTLTLLADSEAGTDQYDQEAVEILAMEGIDVLVECAFVVRIAGLPPCLGPFWPAR